MLRAKSSARGADPIYLALRVYLLVLFPFSLGLWVLPHSQYMAGLPLNTPSENISQADQNISYHFIHNAGEAPGSVQVEALFPLANFVNFPPFVSHDRYQLCFADTGSRFALENGTLVQPDIMWNVSLEDGRWVTLSPDALACIDVWGGEAVRYAWSADLGLAAARQNLSGHLLFNTNTATYPRVLMDWGLLQGLAMIPVFYLFIWYPAAGIWRKIQDGLLAQ